MVPPIGDTRSPFPSGPIGNDRKRLILQSSYKTTGNGQELSGRASISAYGVRGGLLSED